ncbi:hypothetical protein, partial [Frankia nepalensis]|uniref:hypothetical protein n=1 Tax=Frankia nepalensis TaxID=1836974 RepID=UPI001EE4112D
RGGGAARPCRTGLWGRASHRRPVDDPRFAERAERVGGTVPAGADRAAAGTAASRRRHRRG